MRSVLLCIFCFAFVVCSAQITITHGPIVGGVTDTSCNIFVRTSSATPFTILLSNTIPFGSIAGSAAGATDSLLDNTTIVHVGGLSANTTYSMRLTINGVPVTVPTKFQTFNSAGTSSHQVFLTGACMNGLTDADSAIFTRAAAENAKAFINLGNWGYPDVTGCVDIYLTNPPTSWAKTYSNVQNIYKQRYSSTNSGRFLQSLGLDYVYDDHDYINEKSGTSIVMVYQDNIFSGIPGAPDSYSQPAAARPNALAGYKTYFPAYTLPDTTHGIYHSFKSGNAEFFVLDTRSSRGFQLVTVDTVGGSTSHWEYVHDSASHILGNEQMRWLQNSLSQSTATWKFVVSSVPFNMGMQLTLDSLIKLGNGTVPFWNPNLSCYPLLGSHGYSATNHFTDMWAGFKADGDSLLNFVLGNHIPNVFVVSGNTGTAGLDDGVNSGLPELMSGNMKIANTQDALDYQHFMGFNTWDLGGSGLCQQQNLNTTYGRIEIFNDDSIRLSAVDTSGAEVAGANFHAGAAYKYNPAYSPYRLPQALPDVVTISENDSSAIIPVLTNDGAYNGLSLFTNLLSSPAHGNATVNSDNTVAYTPNTGFYGTDTFHYLACDHSNPACQNCSEALVTINISQVNGVRELQGDITFSIYPNPADDHITIRVDNSDESFNFELLDMLGQKVSSLRFSGTTNLNISPFATGNYLYNVRNMMGDLLKIGKIAVFR